MTSLVQDMVNALIAGGFASAAETDIFAWQIRPSPVAQLMVLLTGGREPVTHPLPGQEFRCTWSIPT
jgi:hypothetical protein